MTTLYDQTTALLERCSGAEVEPVEQIVSIKKNRKWWGKRPASPKLSMGFFYELVTAMLHGGTLSGHLITAGDPGVDHVCPDVVSEGAVIEAKACLAGHSILLWDEQVAGYEARQADAPWADVRFVIYRHRFRGIGKFRGTERRIFERLAVETYAAISLPIALVSRLHGPDIYDGWTRRYDEGHSSYSGCTILNSSLMNALLFDPEKTIAEIGCLGVQFKAKTLAVPSLSIDGIKTEPFPMTIIKEVSANEISKEEAEEKTTSAPTSHYQGGRQDCVGAVLDGL